ncbi:MAG TPA: hypothetical protein VFP05_06650 [Thermomicrobiales bacterium]|nr:hypothetical protein [Thermomicrobiales bacterium]
MLDTLLELFERDKKSSTKRSGGLRGRLASALDGERDDDRRHSERRYDDRDRYGDRDDDRRYDARDRRYDRDDDDRRHDDRDDDDYRSSNRKKKREFDFLDFGD